MKEISPVPKYLRYSYLGGSLHCHRHLPGSQWLPGKCRLRGLHRLFSIGCRLLRVFVGAYGVEAFRPPQKARQTTWSARNTSSLTQRLFVSESVDSCRSRGSLSIARAFAWGSLASGSPRTRVAAAAQSSVSVSVHNGTICIAFRRQRSSPPFK